MPHTSRITAAIAAALCHISVAAEESPQIDTLRQEVTVTYATEAAAKDASLAFAPLPDGKKIAFTTRWDDTNDKNVRMSALLKEHGFKGTFFFNWPSKAAVACVENGSDIGSHTTGHQELNRSIPNDVFQFVAQNRVELEAAVDRPVVSFVLPMGGYTSSDPKTPRQIGTALRRAGIMASPEPQGRWNPIINTAYGLSSNTFYVTHLFMADDNKADPVQFREGVARCVKEIEDSDYANPQMTLGMHVWHSDEGFASLGRLLDEYGHKPEWWYCGQNEYASYRYQFHNTAVAKKSTKGKNVTFVLDRPHAAALGAAVPLTLSPSEGAVSVNGSKLVNGLASLPYPATESVPTKIDHIKNKENKKDAVAGSAKFPGLSAGLYADVDADMLHFVLRNDSAEPLRDVRLVFRVPLKWTDGIRAQERFDLAPNTEKKIALPLGERSADIHETDGLLYFIAEATFGDRRLYATAETKAELAPWACPRDTVLRLGPLPMTDEITEELIAMSKPGAELKDIGDTPFGKWMPWDRNGHLRPTQIPMSSAVPNWGEFFKGENAPKTARAAYVIEVEAPEDGEYFLLHGPWDSICLLNGERVKDLWHHTKHKAVTLNKGRNRYMVLHSYGTQGQVPFRILFTTSLEDPDANMLPTHPAR